MFPLAKTKEQTLYTVGQTRTANLLQFLEANNACFKLTNENPKCLFFAYSGICLWDNTKECSTICEIEIVLLEFNTERCLNYLIYIYFLSFLQISNVEYFLKLLNAIFN